MIYYRYFIIHISGYKKQKAQLHTATGTHISQRLINRADTNFTFTLHEKYSLQSRNRKKIKGGTSGIQAASSL